MYNMVKYGLFDEGEEDMLRKSAVFYSAIGAERPPERFKLDNVGKVSGQQIKRDLVPVLRKGERFDLEMLLNVQILKIILWHCGNVGIRNFLTSHKKNQEICLISRIYIGS